MRAVIFANGAMKNQDFYQELVLPGDFIICADGGYAHVSELGLVPDVVLGDFDSMERDHVVCREVLTYPPEKDATDTEIAVDYALEEGFDEILLLGCLGTRMDHSLANLFLLKKIAVSGAQGRILDEHNCVYYCRKQIEVSGKSGDTLSVIPIEGDVEGAVTEGLYYELHGETLHFGSSRGVSNVLTGETAKVSFSKGSALVIVARD
jgi:thiamine pyrophosphokinase